MLRSIRANDFLVFVGFVSFALIMLTTGCASYNTFPTIARPGDTVSIMVGGTEQARKDTIQITLTDSLGGIWNLADPNEDLDRSDSLIRSVFNLRPDGRAVGLHYSSYLVADSSWIFGGHEPTQAVLVVDLPAEVPEGEGMLHINTEISDDSSGIGNDFYVNLDIVNVPDNLGSSDGFLRQDAFLGTAAVNFTDLEPAPHAKIIFDDNSTQLIGAVSLVLDFDETALNPDDLNVFVPQSNVRGVVGYDGAHGENQRMVAWRQDGQKMYINVIAPQGIQPKYLQLYVVHPPNITGSPNFSFDTNGVTVYDIDGNEVSVASSLQYFQ